MRITPKNPLLRAFRGAKRVQRALCTLIKMKDEAANIEAEITRTQEKGAALDLCPIMRFVLLWTPIAAMMATSIAFILLVPSTFVVTTALAPTNERIMLIGYGTLAISGIIMATACLMGFAFAMPKLLTYLFPQKEEATRTMKPKTGAVPAPITRLIPVVMAYARAQHDRFCIRLEVAA